MSRFNTILESNLNKTNLTRIRIKHDPANGLDEMNDYVGYVLEEDGLGNVIAIVPGVDGDTMSLGPDQYEAESPCQQAQQDPLSGFKKHVVDYLMVRGYHDKISDNMNDIINATDVTQLENLLKGCGCDPVGVLNMYRDYVKHEKLR